MDLKNKIYLGNCIEIMKKYQIKVLQVYNGSAI